MESVSAHSRRPHPDTPRLGKHRSLLLLVWQSLSTGSLKIEIYVLVLWAKIAADGQYPTGTLSLEKACSRTGRLARV